MVAQAGHEEESTTRRVRAPRRCPGVAPRLGPLSPAGAPSFTDGARLRIALTERHALGGRGLFRAPCVEFDGERGAVNMEE